MVGKACSAGFQKITSGSATRQRGRLGENPRTKLVWHLWPLPGIWASGAGLLLGAWPEGLCLRNGQEPQL